jgi:membrane protein
MMQNILPRAVYENTLTTIVDIVKRQHGGLLSIGFIAALYFSTNGISAIMNAFNVSVHITETRSVVKQKLIAILLVIILSILTVIAITLIIAGSALLGQLMKAGYLQSSFTYHALMIGKWIIAIALFFFVISFLYYLAPSKHSRFRFISPGSSLATLLFILTSVGFNYYISHFATYNKLYGSIGALIILLVWIYINAIVILIGFELNASLKSARARNKINKARPSE